MEFIIGAYVMSAFLAFLFTPTRINGCVVNPLMTVTAALMGPVTLLVLLFIGLRQWYAVLVPRKSQKPETF